MRALKIAGVYTACLVLVALVRYVCGDWAVVGAMAGALGSLVCEATGLWD